MRPENLLLELKSTTRFPQSILQRLTTNQAGEDISDEFIGGVLWNGKFAWIACGAHLEVFSLKTGNKISSYSFDTSSRLSNTVITCVTEVAIEGINSCVLLVGVQCSPLGGLLYIFSVQGSRVLHRFDVIDRITSCSFISASACRQSSIQKFDGCAAIGTDEGKILLLDLNLKKCRESVRKQSNFISENNSYPSKIVLSSEPYNEIIAQHKRSRIERTNFGIQLEVLPKPTAILSILSLPQLLTIAAGLEDGRMVLYSLTDLNAFHLAFPPERNLPLRKLAYIEPADDPRACVYIWAFHASHFVSVAVMHSIAFEAKTLQNDEYTYENFQSCCPRLTIPIEKTLVNPVACQPISKIVMDEEDDLLSLCLLGWSEKTNGTHVLLFDLNQWYKEQMPDMCNWKEYPSYLAPFPIEGNEMALDVWIDPRAVTTFNSIQRPEEHFYPTSLSFECLKITSTSFARYNWLGLQNQALERLNTLGAAAVLEPDECFYEILETCLFPQFSDQNYHTNPSTRVKQEFLLSMALEYGSISILKQCARLWADGSHQGNQSKDECLCLSTLTEWIWQQANAIKECCNCLCVPLFDHSGVTIDLRSRKILAHCSRQLKLLHDLLDMIVTDCRQYIPDGIFDTLCCQKNSIRMMSEYQEVVQWLLNMGLLPEVAWNQYGHHGSQLSLPGTPDHLNEHRIPVPYPYRILHDYYTAQRQKFFEIDRTFLAPKTNSCRCLFIDTFIERECDSPQLRSEWKNGVGDGLYPPPSLQAMLRVLLIPGIPLENKYALFVYLFLDLNMVLEDDRYVRVVQNLIKFPAVFKLNPTLIKTTQAFWNLDHKEFETALDELISPLTSDCYVRPWQQELLIHTLLVQDMPNLALRALRAPGPTINTVLEIKTLLANDLVAEAFDLQRSKCDDNLLLEFFKGCQHLKKWNRALGLAMTEHEGDVLIKYLSSMDSLLTENLQVLYLLQRNKYVDALTYLETNKYKPRTIELQQKMDNTQQTIFSAYKMAMAPSDRKLSDLFLTVRERINQPPRNLTQVVRAIPFSSQLNAPSFDSNANIIGNVFQTAVLSAKGTNVCFSNEQETEQNDERYIPFLSKPQIDFDYFDNISNQKVHKPTEYVGVSKRRQEDAYNDQNETETVQPKAKRQRTDSFSIANRSAIKHRSMDMNPSLLTSFKILEKEPINISTTNLRDRDESPERNENDVDEVNLLSTPVVKTNRSERRGMDRSEREQTPQSILKHRIGDYGSVASRRSSSPSLTVNSARRSVDFDERSLKYNLDLSADEARLTAIPENEEQSSPYEGIKARTSLRSRSPNTSAQSTSADEFYSPENNKPEPVNRVLREFEEMSDSEETRGKALIREFEEMDEPEPEPKSKAVVTRRKLRSASREPADVSVESTVTPRRKLRSASKEPVEPIISTRVTRSSSRSKQLPLDEPTFSGKLNTSTPLNPIKGRTSIGSYKLLTKPLTAVAETSNATKLFIERNKTRRRSEMKSSDELSESEVSPQKETPKNILVDKSYCGESLLQNTVYSDESTVFSPAPKNILEDSSDVSMTESKDMEVKNAEEKEENPKIFEMEEMEETSEHDNAENTESNEQSKLEESKSASKEVINDEQTQAVGTIEKVEEKSVFTQQITSSNILRDETIVSETFVQQTIQSDEMVIHNETSTFFSHTKNVLEDSSIGPQLAEHTMKTLHQPQNEDEDSSSTSVSDSDDDESLSSTSENNESTSNQEENESEVINISSSSDEESNDVKEVEEVEYLEEDEIEQEHFATVALEFSKSNDREVSFQGQNEENRPPSTDYNIIELKATPMDSLPDPASADVSDLLYGDLVVNEMIEQSASSAVYFDTLSGPRDDFTLHSSGVHLVIPATVSETLSTDTLDRGFIDDSTMIATQSDLNEPLTQTSNVDENATKTLSDLNKAMIADESTNAVEVTKDESEETNIFEKAMIAEHKDSGMDATMESPNKSEKKTEQVEDNPSTPKRRRRSTSVSSKAESVSSQKNSRSTRATSVTLNSPAKSLRGKRSTSHSSLVDLAEENVIPGSPARIMTRRQSQLLDNIAESPQTPTRGRRRTVSTTSETETASNLKKAPSLRDLDKTVTTPTRRSARLRESDAESVLSTPSSRHSIDRELSATPTSGRRRKTESKEPSEAGTSKATRVTRSRTKRTGKDDDAMSETSSIASTDNVSTKSGKTSKRGRPPSTLPVISEDDQEKNPVQNIGEDFLASGRRLTRAQLATMEKYSKGNRRVVPEPPTTRRTRTQSKTEPEEEAEEHAESDDDTKSFASNTSRGSKASRSSKRLQARKK